MDLMMNLQMEELEIVNSLDFGDDFVKGFEKGVEIGLKIVREVISIGGIAT